MWPRHSSGSATKLRMDAQRRSRGGFSGNSPDALLLNLFITGAAEEEKGISAASTMAPVGTNADERNVYRRKRAYSNTAGRQGGQMCRLSVSVPNNYRQGWDCH